MAIRKIFCQKYQSEEEGLAYPPYPGEIGEKIYKHICKKAWNEWMEQQTKIINEYRLNPLEESAQKMLEESMQAFLFQDKSQA